MQKQFDVVSSTGTVVSSETFAYLKEFAPAALEGSVCCIICRLSQYCGILLTLFLSTYI